MKPHIHAENSVAKYGGVVNDYIEIHEFMDSSKAIVANNLHRMFTHNSWFIRVVLPKVFGLTIINSDGKVVSVHDIGEDHVVEDFRMRFIPSPDDYLTMITEVPEWVNGINGYPPNYKSYQITYLDLASKITYPHSD